MGIKMKKQIFLILLLMTPISVMSEIVKTGTTINTTGGNTVSKFGNNLLKGSDGTTYQRFGNAVKDSNGHTWQIFGNKIKRSDGKTCSIFGNSIKCDPQPPQHQANQ